MFLFSTTNWKIFEITRKNVSSGYIRFYLDDYVGYEDGSEKWIDCSNSYPYYYWEEGDDIKINIGKTWGYSSYATFDDSSIVKKVSSSSARINDSLRAENSTLRGELSSKDSQISSKDSQISSYSAQLAGVQEQVREKDRQIVVKDGQIERLRNMFDDLKIESNNKDNKIGELKKSLNESQEENFRHRLRIQEERLDTFIQQLKVDRNKIRGLQKAYYQLIRYRENYDQESINEAKEIIEKIKDELLSGGWLTWKVSIENTQELCRKCEKIAKLQIEQEKLYQQQYQERQNQQQQQYQARQEQQTNNN